MTVSKIRLNGTDHDIRAKYLIQSTSADAVSAEFSARTVTQDGIANIQKIYGNTVVVSDTLVSNSATAILSKDSSDNVIGRCDLNITTLTGKLNGAGSSVVIYSEGMKKAVAVYDELTRTKANKRLGRVDLGTLIWEYNSTNQYMFVRRANFSSLPDYGSVVCAKYNTAASLSEIENGQVATGGGTYHLVIKDTEYTSAATFKTAMSGVMLDYELATPQEYILDNALQLQYPVVAGGTEMVLPTTGTAPMKMDVIYGNAADAAATMSQNFISVDSMKEFLAALGAQMGGTWSMGYENGKHTFTFTSN